MPMIEEFKRFALKGNVVDLAVGVVIGAAFGKIVSALVADLVMPVIGLLLPGGDWRAYSVTSLNLKVGDFLGTVLDFLIISFVLFLIVAKLMGTLKKEPPAAPTTKSCPECLENVPLQARRCKFCTSVIVPA